MSDESGRAVVFYNENAVSVPFRNFSARGKTEISSMINEDIHGVLIVFNALEQLLNISGRLNADEKKMIDGLSSEISVAYVNGWKVIYYVSFKKFAKFTIDQLPREFTTSDDDSLFNKTTLKDMTKLVHSFTKLKNIRLIGVISKKELESIGKSLRRDELKFNSDSPYLVVVNS